MERVCHASGGAYPGGVRAGAGRPDRRVAFAAFLIVAATFAVVIARSGESELSATPPDPTAAPQMLDLMRAGEARDSVATYDFIRRARGGTERPSQVREAQVHGTQVSRAGDALDITTATTTYHCQLVDAKPDCAKTNTRASIPASAVFAAAIGTGKYVVRRVPDATIAGEPARCFRTTAIGGHPYLRDLGTETLACFAADGVLLRKQVAQPNPVDDLVATSVQRRVDDATLAPLLAGFEEGTPGLGG
jgi:hypothetical protein